MLKFKWKGVERKINTIFIGLGSNLGDRKKNIHTSLQYLKKNPAIEIKKTSTIIETKPVGLLEQPDFLNCVIEIATKLTATELLDILQEIENKMGRKRKIKWGPRIIDLDILFYGNKIIKTKRLTIPHKEIVNRKFVLRSLYEISPSFIHPEFKKDITFLYENFTE